jgi:hypothetical protein
MAQSRRIAQSFLPPKEHLVYQSFTIHLSAYVLQVYQKKVLYQHVRPRDMIASFGKGGKDGILTIVQGMRIDDC